AGQRVDYRSVLGNAWRVSEYLHRLPGEAFSARPFSQPDKFDREIVLVYRIVNAIPGPLKMAETFVPRRERLVGRTQIVISDRHVHIAPAQQVVLFAIAHQRQSLLERLKSAAEVPFVSRDIPYVQMRFGELPPVARSPIVFECRDVLVPRDSDFEEVP